MLGLWFSGVSLESELLDLDSPTEKSNGLATPTGALNLQKDFTIVSPDSCLDEDTILEDQNLCMEYASSPSNFTHELYDTNILELEKDRKSDSSDLCHGPNINAFYNYEFTRWLEYFYVREDAIKRIHYNLLR